MRALSLVGKLTGKRLTPRFWDDTISLCHPRGARETPLRAIPGSPFRVILRLKGRSYLLSLSLVPTVVSSFNRSSLAA